MTLSPVTASSLSTLSGIHHAWFTREGGVSEGIYRGLNGGLGSNDERAHVLENRRRMANYMAVEQDHFLSVWQIHSADVIPVAGPWTGERPKADAMVTATPGLAISIATADCGPILFADSKNKIIGAAHAGWQGAFKGILESTLAAMEALGAKRETIHVAIGPMLSQRNYEVGPEFVARFIEQSSSHSQFFKPSEKASHAYFDLPAYIEMRLKAAGAGHVQDLGLCTYADADRFYSYRRTTHAKEADYGRLISAIMLEA